MYRKKITRPVPGNAETIAPNRVRVRSGRKWVERDLNPSGMMVCESKCYYGRVRQPDGTLKEIRLTHDRASSEQILANLRLKSARIASGLEQEPNPRRHQPLPELANEWLAEMQGAGRNAGHIRTVRSRVHSIIRNCEFATANDLSKPESGARIISAFNAMAAPKPGIELPKGQQSFSPMELRTLLVISHAALGKLARNRGIEPTGKGKARRYTREQAEELISYRTRGAAPNTLNGARTSIRAFCNWLVRNGIIEKVPPMPLRNNERKDRRLVRRAISWEECLRLAESVEAEGKHRGGMTATERSVLYQVAFCTLLRARALRELTPSDCQLMKKPYNISVRAETDKTGKARLIPIDEALRSKLVNLVTNKKTNEPIWKVSENITDILRKDLIKTKILFRNEKGVCDFHALRHSGATHLANSGIRLDMVAHIGGWRNINQFYERYSHHTVNDLDIATRRCWPCPERKPEEEINNDQ